MQAEQLLEHVAPEHRERAKQLYATFVEMSGPLADESIDSFASSLHKMGLLSAAGLQDFLTYHALTIGVIDAGGARARYEPMTTIGQGAMGEVFLGRDPSLKRTVAIKRVHAELAADPLLLQRFFNEAQVTAQLDHPAIVPVYGLERDEDGVLSYAMKFVRGLTLTQYLEEAREQIEEHGKPAASHSLKARIETFIPVLNALAYAHRRGVIHRDLKPDNVMVGSFGEVLVMDWGIARVSGQGEEIVVPGADGAEGAQRPPMSLGTNPGMATHPKLTIAGTVLGTPSFMSPEQAAGVDVDERSDQYTLGLILQEIITLKPAMHGETIHALFARAIRGMREPMNEGTEPIARELRAIVDRATAPKRDDRYPTVTAFAEDLRRFLRDESVEADPDRGLRKVTRWIGKHRGLSIALAAALLAVALAVIAIFIWQGQLALAEEREAARAKEQSLVGLEALVDAQGMRMGDEIHRYESLLEGIAATATLALREPAPPSNAVVYTYAGGQRTPAALPDYAVESKAYRQPASLRADYSAMYGVDVKALSARVDQLARVEPVLRQALLRSISEASVDLPFGEAEKLVLERGAPLLWTYLHTEDGLAVGVPGTWMYEDSPGGIGYDHRREDWYKIAVGSRGPLWTVSADESGLGLTINCVQTIRDANGKLVAIAGVDVWLNRFIDELLEIPALKKAGAEALLLDTSGNVLVRSSEKDKASTLSEYTPKAWEEREVVAALRSIRSGHHAATGNRIAVWMTLGSAGLVYVIVGPEAAMLAAVPGS